MVDLVHGVGAGFREVDAFLKREKVAVMDGERRCWSALEVSRRRVSPTAIGRTPPVFLGMGLRVAAENRVR